MAEGMSAPSGKSAEQRNRDLIESRFKRLPVFYTNWKFTTRGRLNGFSKNTKGLLIGPKKVRFQNRLRLLKSYTHQNTI